MEFVTGHAGTEHISAADMASFYRGLLIADDVVLATGSKFSCEVIDANTVEIGTGDCMLQAHHARIDIAEQLTIESGTNGYNRNDLIVARYTLGDSNVQSIYLAVVKGTPVAGTAEDPTVTEGDIDEGATLVEFPLWRIPITGVNVGTPVRVMPTVDTLQEQIEGVRDSLDGLSTTVSNRCMPIKVGFSDFNTFATNGWGTSYSPSNSPKTGWMVGFCYKHYDGYLMQLAISLYDNGIWMRTCDAGTWKSWKAL